MAHWTETLFKEQADVYTRFFESRFDAAEDQAADLLDLVGTVFDAQPESALDLACGIGRHVVAFADRGLDAEGIDFSEQFVAEGRDRIRERGLDDRASIHQHDLRELDEWSGSYDLVTSFWNSLGYYDKATDERILGEAHRLLAEDGVLAIEIGNKDYYLANLEPVGVDEDDDGLSLERRDYDPETGRFRTQLDLFDATDGYEHAHTMEWENRVYAPPVLREMLHDAGFADVSLFGGFDGTELALDSETLLALAR